MAKGVEPNDLPGAASEGEDKSLSAAARVRRDTERRAEERDVDAQLATEEHKRLETERAAREREKLADARIVEERRKAEEARVAEQRAREATTAVFQSAAQSQIPQSQAAYSQHYQYGSPRSGAEYVQSGQQPAQAYEPAQYGKPEKGRRLLPLWLTLGGVGIACISFFGGVVATVAAHKFFGERGNVGIAQRYERNAPGQNGFQLRQRLNGGQSGQSGEGQKGTGQSDPGNGQSGNGQERQFVIPQE